MSEQSDTTSSTVIQFLKEQFSRHGIADCLVNDNGSYIVIEEFHEFTTAWKLKHITSFPPYPKSNGKAEYAVKIVKHFMKKTLKDSKDQWLALLEYRKSPTEGHDRSPAQQLLSWRTSTLLPTASSLLHPKVVDGVGERIMQNKQKATYFQDRTAKALPEIKIGQKVRSVYKSLETVPAWYKHLSTQSVETDKV